MYINVYLYQPDLVHAPACQTAPLLMLVPFLVPK